MLRLSMKSSTFRTFSKIAKRTTIPSRQQSSTSAQGSSISNVTYGIFGGLAITIAGGIKYVNDHVGGTEGLERTVSFYSLAIPAYVQYRAHMMLESSDETWNQLDIETSQKGLTKILELGGFYIKSGQLCAANIGNGECQNVTK